MGGFVNSLGLSLKERPQRDFLCLGLSLKQRPQRGFLCLGRSFKARPLLEYISGLGRVFSPHLDWLVLKARKKTG